MRRNATPFALALLALVACLALPHALAQKQEKRQGKKTEGSPLLVSVNRKYGYVDRAGKVVVEPKYDEASEFSEGLALVSYGREYGPPEETPDGMTFYKLKPGAVVRWEFIDATGKTVVKIPEGMDVRGGFYEGLAPFSEYVPGRGGVYGFIDREGKVAIKPQFTWIEPFNEGLASACVEHGKCGFIDKTGAFVIPPKYVRTSSFSEGFGVVETDFDLSGFVNREGEMVIQPQFGSRAGLSFYDGLAVFTFTGGDRYGFMDRLGHTVIEPQFEQAGPFGEGLAPVQSGGKWGYIDKTGKFVIPPRFTTAYPFTEGLAVASTTEAGAMSAGGAYGFIDKTGKFVIEERFNNGAHPFRDGIAQVFTTEGRGYIDREGKYIWKPTW